MSFTDLTVDHDGRRENRGDPQMRAEVKANAKQKIRMWRSEAETCPNQQIAAQLKERARGGDEILTDIENGEVPQVPTPRYSSPPPPPPDTPFRSA